MSLIAIIDDDPSVRRALERLLRAAGYRVASYASGAEFLPSLETAPPACAIVDIHMPGLTGFDILAALREKRSASVAVVLTADQDPQTRVRALGLGAAACVTKPFNDTLLLEAIASAIDSAARKHSAVNARARCGRS
jgi:FixJ family two-component response regulator